MNVDPAILRAFARMLEQSSGALRGLDAAAPFGTSERAVSGTEFDEASTFCSTATTAATVAVAGRIDSIADVAAGVARDYAITEDEFTAKLATMDGPR
ncbi:MAG: hypothetical protein WBQ44_18200 [Rhodococcus sp. (in: high G+C Gram-positive bacteria)]